MCATLIKHSPRTQTIHTDSTQTAHRRQVAHTQHTRSTHTQHTHAAHTQCWCEQPACRYWVGRALRVHTVFDQAGSVEGTGGRVRYDAGDCEIAIEWFQRDVSGGDERRTFKAWVADTATDDAGPLTGHTYTFNSTELRLISTPSTSAGAAMALEMRALPPVGGVPLHTVARSCARLASQPRPNYRNVVYQVHETRADPVEQMWEITTGSERVILDNCW